MESIYKKYYKKGTEYIFTDAEISDAVIKKQQSAIIDLLVKKKEVESLQAQIGNVLEYCEVNNIQLENEEYRAVAVSYFKGKFWQIYNRV
jgi:S-adenosylmethionine:tRNA-ribosyltransferase-isomerase (queuine synthetase)